jgi:catechol 2,3-dioxygenase-like lactoylglutathione lyase family enzyme
MSTKPIVGLHHVTAIASNPQQNLDCYTMVFGLRFVKRPSISTIPAPTTLTSGTTQERPGPS